MTSSVVIPDCEDGVQYYKEKQGNWALLNIHSTYSADVAIDGAPVVDVVAAVGSVVVGRHKKLNN